MRYVAIILCAALFTATPVLAQVQTICGFRTEILERLRNNWRETSIIWAVKTDGGLIEVFTSKESWSLVETPPGCHEKALCTCITRHGGTLRFIPENIRKAFDDGL